MKEEIESNKMFSDAIIFRLSRFLGGTIERMMFAGTKG